MLGPDRLAIWETAVRYQLVHALGLLAIAGLAGQRSSPWLRGAAACLVAGVIVFSGSLYLLCLTGAEWLGAITPIGGVVWIVGWAFVGAHGLRGAG